MNIKQKLTWAFGAIASVPILLVAAVVIFNLRSQAQTDFIEGSGREIRQIDNAMDMFFRGISENVEYVASLPLVASATELSNYTNSDASSTPLTPASKQLEVEFGRFAKAHPTTAYLSYGRIGRTPPPVVYWQV